MPYINLQWKGYPHHLPKIRVASTPSVSVRNRSNAATKQVLSIPLGTALEEKRKKQRFFRVRRRRGRSSRSSAKVRARRQASHRARQNIQVFGWDSPNAELASKATTEIQFRSRQSTPRTPRILPSHIGTGSESEIPSTDGAASSLVRRSNKPMNSEGRYSLMQVAETPTKSQRLGRFSFESDPLSDGSDRRAAGEYSHTNDTARAYNTWIDPITGSGNRRRSAIPQVKPTFREIKHFQSPPKKKQSSASPNPLETLDPLTRTSKREGSESLSIQSLIQSVFSNSSRTPSQRKALRRYTREIELYWQAVRTLPRQSLVPSTTATSISANTILEFRPYQSQFQSAGLAVTSKEQCGEFSIEDFPMPPPTPPKDKKWRNMARHSKNSRIEEDKSTTEVNGKAPTKKPRSFASSSTGTTVIGFTPPYEKTDARPPQRKNSLGMDDAVFGFAPHEKVVDSSPPGNTSTKPEQSTRRSLPWLRKPSLSPEASPVRHSRSTPVERTVTQRPSTHLQGWVSTFDISPESSPRENTGVAELPKDLETTSRRTSASRWRETNPSPRRVDSNKMTEKSLNAQSMFKAFDDAGEYVSTAVQADAFDIEESEPKVRTAPNQIVEHAPILSLRDRTFPLSPKKCKGDYNETSQSVAEVSPRKHSQSSRITWQGIESSTQTEAKNNFVVEKSQKDSKREAKKPSIPSAAPIADCSRTFPFSSRDTRSSKLIQRAPRLRSTKKSIDESKLESVQISDAEEQILAPPTRQPPSPPQVICDQCARPLNVVVGSEGEQSSPEPDFEPEVNTTVHACTSRSSMLCQQCFPSREDSLDMSPPQANLPVDVSYFPSSRRSTRPVILTGPMTYVEREFVRTEQPVLEVTQFLDTEKGKEIHKAIVNEALEDFTKRSPIADPMKRPSLPRLKLNPNPMLHASPKRSRGTSRMPQIPMMAQRPVAIAVACPLDHVAASSSSVDSVALRSGQVTDKQVFRGLHVATAAACDEDVDKWIEEIRGTGVRKFLADLSAFEGLGVNTLANVAKRAAKQRRDQSRAWEEVRERRLASQSREMKRREDSEDDGSRAGSFVIGDQGVHWHGGNEAESQEGDDQGVRAREAEVDLGTRYYD